MVILAVRGKVPQGVTLVRVGKYDAILFDFDGVLADTEPLHWRCWRQALEPLGIELDRTRYFAHCIGIADRDLLPFFAGLAPAPLLEEALQEAYARKRKLYQALLATRAIIPEQICALIKALCNIQIGIVTSSHACDIEPPLIRAGVRDRVGALVCAEQVSRKKPDPEGYLLAASILQVKSPLVVEDSDAGQVAGQAAGFDVIRVSSPDEVPAAVGSALQDARFKGVT